MKSEQLIEIAGKLYSCRRALRSLLRDEYPEQVIKWMDGVRAHAAKARVSEISACLQIAKALQMAGQDMAVMWVMAATVELMEPDEITPALEPVKP